MKSVSKRTLALLLVLLLVASVFAACGDSNTPNTPDTPDTPVTPPPEATEDGGMTYADPTYFPVVKNPLTLSALICDNQTMGDWTARTLWNVITEKTGVTFKLDVINSLNAENVKLMFASREYPDVSFRIDTETVLQNEACLAGDILELTDDMLSKFAPNWVSIFEKYPEIKTLSKQSNGKLYGLPQFVFETDAYELRDVHAINTAWLDELGMAVPETLDEYTAYLRAVKAAAGTGSIPTDVVPLLMRTNTNIGGWYNFLDMAGCYSGYAFDYVLNNETCCTNFNNPNAKIAIKYLATLWSEGLINKDFMTIDWAGYQAAVANESAMTKPYFVGSYFGYALNGNEFLTFLPPFKMSADIEPYVRDMGMQNRLIKNAFTIFANCKYPVAALRTLDAFAGEDETVRMMYGEAGEDSVYKILEDGTYVYVTDEDRKNSGYDVVVPDEKAGWSNFGPGIVSEEIYKQLARNTINNENERAWGFYNVYQDYLPDNMEMFPDAAWTYVSKEEYDEYTSLRNMLRTLVNSYTNNFIQGKKDVDAEWDTFQSKLVDIGIDRMLELEQKAFDAYKAALNG